MTVSSSAIPFRFKAGSDPAPGAFHHRKSSQTTHKAFKSRHATKSLLKELSKGKINGKEKQKSRKTPQQQVMSKIDRRNKAKQARLVKQQQHARSTTVFAGASGAPRIVPIVPLSDDISVSQVIESLTTAADADAQWPMTGNIRVRIERFKQTVFFAPVKFNTESALEACKASDFVVFVLSSNQEASDEAGALLKAIECQGVGNVIFTVQGLDNLEDNKKKQQRLFDLKDWVKQYYPNKDKVLDLDSRNECANAVRSLCTTVPKGIKWREDRSWMLVEDVRWSDESQKQPDPTVGAVITGVIRGKSLNADRLVHVGHWGTFQIDKITNAALPAPRRSIHNDVNAVNDVDAEEIQLPGAGQEQVDELAPYEAPMVDADAPEPTAILCQRKGVLIDDDHFYSSEEDDALTQPKRVPKGTSTYQSAWFLGDESGSDSDYEGIEADEGDVDMNGVQPADGAEGLDLDALPDTTDRGTEYPASEMFLDPSPAQEAAQIEEYRKSRKDKAKEDLEFPDEIELHPNVLARERLAKYRGLKSLRTSPWDTSEDRFHEPEDWQRLLQVPDHKRARKQAENDALVGGVQPGTRVHVHLRGVPLSIRRSFQPQQPLSMHSLLQHEQKRSVINVSITLSSSHQTPIKSKDELIIQCGPRRMIINPLFSQLGSTPNDVHKFLRYLHPGQIAVASFIAPITWGSVPALFFKRTESALELIGTGTVLPPSTSRVIAKRVILTGHPFKIHRKLVTVRYMFFNKEDINWFKALQMWTKWGRSGFIKESLGTHGYFKATFDGKINPQDAVGVSLYKRVWPRVARPWTVEDREFVMRIGEGGAMVQ